MTMEPHWGLPVEFRDPGIHHLTHLECIDAWPEWDTGLIEGGTYHFDKWNGDTPDMGRLYLVEFPGVSFYPWRFIAHPNEHEEFKSS